jgi:hypothetical protein
MSAHEAQAGGLISFNSGKDLVQWMEAYEECEMGDCSEEMVLPYGLFMGFVGGVSDVLLKEYRTPSNLAQGQVFSIVVKHIKEHPERWTEPAYILVMDALKKAFPITKVK